MLKFPPTMKAPQQRLRGCLGTFLKKKTYLVTIRNIEISRVSFKGSFQKENSLVHQQTHIPMVWSLRRSHDTYWEILQSGAFPA